MSDISTMNGTLVTRDSLHANESNDLIVYIGDTTMPARDVVVQVKSFVDGHPGSVASICLLAPAFRENAVHNVMGCGAFIDLKESLGVESHAYFFQQYGQISGIGDARRDQMLRRVLTRLVGARHGVLGASGAVHYAKPSQKHTDQFIRTGNVLVNSVEVEMIAWACLPHLPESMSFVYTDTGAINVVAASVRELLRGFRAPAANFSIDSFGSYKGLKTFKGVTDGSCWLISATTSGNLASTIIEKQGVTASQILSLFSLGVVGGRAACCLDHDERHNPSGFQPIHSYPPDDCALCHSGSTPLWLTDEQFLVSDIDATPYLPTKNDLPPTTLNVLNQLVGQNVFRVSFQPNRHTESSDIFLDLEPHASGILASAPTPTFKLAAQFGRRVRQSLPAAVDVIAHLDDPASKALAYALHEFVKSCGREPGLVSASALSEPSFDSKPQSVVVVASTVASGTSVVDLSRMLRRIETVTSVTYFVLVDRSVTKVRAEQTTQSVTVTEDGHRYDYHVIARLPLPDPSAVTWNPWDKETELLQRLLGNCSDDDLKAQLETRRTALDLAKSTLQRGLKDGLFWPAENGEQLKLSRGFVYLPTDFVVATVSQADVYAIIRALLHNLRTTRKDGKEPALGQHPLHRKVLDTGVFYRFNDAVLQAAFLRSAAPAELDYSFAGTKTESANARLLLARVFREQAAAATEFALALALGRLRVTAEDKAQVLAEVDALRQPLGVVTMAFLNTWRLV